MGRSRDRLVCRESRQVRFCRFRGSAGGRLHETCTELLSEGREADVRSLSGRIGSEIPCRRMLGPADGQVYTEASRTGPEPDDPEETLPERHQRLHFDHHPGVQIWCRRRMCPRACLDVLEGSAGAQARPVEGDRDRTG